MTLASMKPGDQVAQSCVRAFHRFFSLLARLLGRLQYQLLLAFAFGSGCPFRQLRPGGLRPQATIPNVGQRRLFGLPARLLGAIKIELQRVIGCRAGSRLLSFRRSLLFQLQVGGAHLAGPILLQLI
jgi:hypothetical protein